VVGAGTAERDVGREGERAGEVPGFYAWKMERRETVALGQGERAMGSTRDGFDARCASATT